MKEKSISESDISAKYYQLANKRRKIRVKRMIFLQYNINKGEKLKKNTKRKSSHVNGNLVGVKNWRKGNICLEKKVSQRIQKTYRRSNEAGSFRFERVFSVHVELRSNVSRSDFTEWGPIDRSTQII